MNLLIHLPELSTGQWWLVMVCAVLIGMSKAGIKGMGMLTIPLMAAVFGGKPSAGLVLPILSFADLFAVSYYNRDANWKYIWQLIPAAVLGVLIAVWVGQLIDDATFTSLMGWLIVGGLVLMIILEKRHLPSSIINSWWFGSLFGIIGGFSTMIGNAAGPVLAVYLLSTRIPKQSFIGTGAWFFLLINLVKWPFHIFIWKTITWSSISLNVLTIPAIALGVYIGISIVKLIPEKTFRYFIIFMTFIIALRLIFW